MCSCTVQAERLKSEIQIFTYPISQLKSNPEIFSFENLEEGTSLRFIMRSIYRML